MPSAEHFVSGREDCEEAGMRSSASTALRKSFVIALHPNRSTRGNALKIENSNEGVA